MENIKTIQEFLTKAIFEVFERMYYIFSEPQKGGNGDYHIQSTITFSGPTNGSVELFLSKGIAETMAKNMLNLPQDKIDLPIMEDCVKESLNMICGNFVRKLDPDRIFDLSIPVFAMIPAAGSKGPATGDHQVDLTFVTDGGDIRLILTAPDIV